jgi:3-phosphoshikimate 1-carboxyvinyltransferase
MALAVAGMAASGETLIRGSESIKVTYPSFVESMKSLGGNIKSVE